MAARFTEYYVEGDFGGIFRFRFRSRLLTGFTAAANLWRTDSVIPLTVALTTDDGGGGSYVDITWQAGELTAGTHKVEIILTTAGSQETRPTIEPIIIKVREKLD